MNKDTLLANIREALQTGIVTRADIEMLWGGRTDIVKEKKGINISQVLYFIGGVVVFIGIIVLVATNWEVLNTFTKILVTLGSGIASYIAGALFNRYDSFKRIGAVFFALSMLLIPFGLAISFDEGGIDLTSGVQATIALIMMCITGLSLWIFKKNIFASFLIASGTWFYYSFATTILDNNQYFSEFNFYAYLTLFAGLSYALISYGISRGSNEQRKELCGGLYSIGLIAFLGAPLAIGGFWDLIYIGLVIAVAFLSVHMKNKIFLRLGALFLMAYIIKITGNYFTDSLGWPLALVIAGIVLMAVGYFAHHVSKKYITEA